MKVTCRDVEFGDVEFTRAAAAAIRGYDLAPDGVFMKMLFDRYRVPFSFVAAFGENGTLLGLLSYRELTVDHDRVVAYLIEDAVALVADPSITEQMKRWLAQWKRAAPVVCRVEGSV